MKVKAKTEQSGNNKVTHSASLTDLTTCFSLVILMGLSTIGTFTAYKIIPQNLNNYPNYLYTYSSQLLVPNLVSFVVMMFYFVRNNHIRISIVREIKEMFRLRFGL